MATSRAIRTGLLGASLAAAIFAPAASASSTHRVKDDAQITLLQQYGIAVALRR